VVGIASDVAAADPRFVEQFGNEISDRGEAGTWHTLPEAGQPGPPPAEPDQAHPVVALDIGHALPPMACAREGGELRHVSDDVWRPLCL
jgi:hypothetical protein